MHIGGSTKGLAMSYLIANLLESFKGDGQRAMLGYFAPHNASIGACKASL